MFILPQATSLPGRGLGECGHHTCTATHSGQYLFILFICLHLPSCEAGGDVWLTLRSARHTIQNSLHATTKGMC